MKDRKFKFRGFNNPSIEGAEVYYGDGEFTIGKIYYATEIDESCTEINGADASFIDDNGHNLSEDLCFFDELLD